MRIGEVLVAAGLITEQQLAEALRAQVMWGGRLGTCLVELGTLRLDDLSKALGKQHGMPAALSDHFARADRELQNKLPVELAEKFQCVPLVIVGKRVVIASVAPLSDKAVALVAGQLDINRHMVVQAIAAEMRMRFQLERVYDIQRGQRFMRSRGVTDQSQLFSLPALQADRPATELSTAAPPILRDLTLPELPISDAPAPAARETGVERRAYLTTLADMLTRQPDRESVIARAHRERSIDAMRPFAIGSMPLKPIESAVIPESINEALAEIVLSADRGELARRVIGTVARFLPECHSALLLVVRGDAAVTQISFCRDGTELPALAVPLDHAGLVAAVMRRKVTTRGASGDLGPIDYLLLTSLGLQFGDLVVAPVPVLDHVIGMVVLATEHRGTLGRLEDITAATGDAFTRLMKNAAN